MPPISRMTPPQIDTILARWWEQNATYGMRLHRMLEHNAKAAAEPHAHRRVYPESELAPVRAKIEEAWRESAPYEKEYERRPWKRYYLVTNGTGHVHRERRCTTCFSTTRYAWLVELSGCDEKQMVAEYGEKACTVCFPDAPSMYRQLGGKARIEHEGEAKRAARTAKPAAATAAKAEKAITSQDGTPLRGKDGERIDTVYMAWQELVHVTATVVVYRKFEPGSYVATHEQRYHEALERIAAALAHKTARPVAEIKAEGVAKAKRRGY